MDIRKFILKETGIVAVGEMIGTAVLIGIFALMGYYDGTVFLGGVVGALIATVNFFFMALATQSAADKAQEQDVKGGKMSMKSSYTLRMVAIFAVVFAFAKSGLCNPLAMVIPLVFVRPTITVAEFFRKSGEKKV